MMTKEPKLNNDYIFLMKIVIILGIILILGFFVIITTIVYQVLSLPTA